MCGNCSDENKKEVTVMDNHSDHVKLKLRKNTAMKKNSGGMNTWKALIISTGVFILMSAAFFNFTHKGEAVKEVRVIHTEADKVYASCNKIIEATKSTYNPRLISACIQVMDTINDKYDGDKTP